MTGMLTLTEADLQALLERNKALKVRTVTPLKTAEKRQKAERAVTDLRSQSTTLIDKLAQQICEGGFPEPVRELQFDPVRKYRFDLAIHVCPPRNGVAVELDGIWAHRQPENVERDRNKDALALHHGWLVVRVTPSMVRDGSAFRAICNGIDIRTGKA